MLIVRDFLMKLMMLFDIIAKANTSEIKVGFDFVLESQVEGIPICSKAGNKSQIEKSMGYHSETEVKGLVEPSKK